MTSRRKGNSEPAAKADESDAASKVPTQGASADAGSPALAGGAAPPVKIVAEPPPSPGDEFFARGNLAGAVDYFHSILATHSEDVEALLGLGTAYLAQGQYDAAERELRKALRLAPNRMDLNYQLSMTLFRRGNYAAAANQLRRVVELDNDHASALVFLGEALNHTGEGDAAIEALERAVRLQPENGRAFYALGIAHDRKGQPERAAEMYRRSREVGGRGQKGGI